MIWNYSSVNWRDHLGNNTVGARKAPGLVGAQRMRLRDGRAGGLGVQHDDVRHRLAGAAEQLRAQRNYLWLRAECGDQDSLWRHGVLGLYSSMRKSNCAPERLWDEEL